MYSLNHLMVGYAVSDSLDGVFIRCDEEIKLTSDANNPAPYYLEDGSIAIMYISESEFCK